MSATAPGLEAATSAGADGTAGARRLVGLLLLVASAGYVCRVAVTVAGPGMMADFRLTQAQLGLVFSAFLVGYTLFQVPSGWLADRIEARRLFLTMALAWVILTLATAAVRGDAAGGGVLAFAGLPVLLAVRALFGATAAPTYPASARTIALNLPARVQGTANGAVLASIGIGSAAAPLALGAAVRAWGWRPALLLAAALALLALLAWATWAPRGLRTSPLAGSGPAPAASAKSLSSPRYLALVASYTLQGYIGYIFVFWFYLYLVQVRHFEIMQAAAVSALPWICTLVAIPLGGVLSDAAVRRFGATWGRRLVPFPALVLAGGLLVVGARTPSAWVAVLCLTLCTVLVIGTEGPYWATLGELTGARGGTGGGIMNFGCNIGGMISPAATPWLAQRIGWAPALTLTAGVAVVAGVLWLFVGPGPAAGAGPAVTAGPGSPPATDT